MFMAAPLSRSEGAREGDRMVLVSGLSSLISHSEAPFFVTFK
jgi:hypothetical protein